MSTSYELAPSELLGPAEFTTRKTQSACVVCLFPFFLSGDTNCLLCGALACERCINLVSVAGQDDQVPVCATCFHYHEKLFGKFIEGPKPDRVGRKWPTNKYFARPEDLVRRDKTAPRDKCTLCARSFSVFRHRHTCVTCGLVHCSQCTVSGLALHPGAATSVAIAICDTCSSISIVEKSYANCKTLRAQLRALVAAPDFPANTLGLDRDEALFRALSMATNGTLAEHTFASPDKIVPLQKRSACSHCGSCVSYWIHKHNCVSCGNVFCFLCVVTKVAGTKTPLGPLRVVPQCFACHAAQCFGENPWLPRTSHEERLKQLSESLRMQ